MGRIALSPSIAPDLASSLAILPPRKAACVASLLALTAAIAGCDNVQAISASSPPNPVTRVVPSVTGTPNSIVAFGNFEFVSVQGAGLIVTYAPNSDSVLPLAVNPMPCADPSGMAALSVGGANVLAAICFDSGSVLTFLINSDGTLHRLASLSGLPQPYPGIALDGTNLYVPLFGGGTANGAVAQINIANPLLPALTGMVTLASSAPGEIVNAVSLAASDGYIYVAAGSESLPLNSSSSVQVIRESSMTLVGAPLIVPHSPQQIAISGGTAYITLYDTAEVEAIDITNPAALRSVASASLPDCHPVPIAVAEGVAYVGCYGESSVARLDVANPAQIEPLTAISGIASPQDIAVSGASLLITDASPGGALYTIDLSELE